MLRKIILLLLSILLSGCFDVEQRVRINENGSGTMTFSFTFTKSFMEMGMFEDEPDKNFNIEREDIVRELSAQKGVKLESFETKRIGEDLFLTFTLSFKDINQIKKKGLFELSRYRLKNHQGRFQWRQRFSFDETETQRDEEDIREAEKWMKQHTITFIVEFPRPVASANFKANISGNTVTWKFLWTDFIRKPSIEMKAQTQ